jgi:hypothetical protein
MKTKESKWIVEDIGKSNKEEPNSDAVSGKQTEKNRAKRRSETKLLEGGKSNDLQQEPERKRKKNQNKKEKAKKFQAVHNSDGNKEKCISYLKRWHKDRQNWKFEKLRQIWLFRNMFDPLKVSRNTLDCNGKRRTNAPK